MRILVWNIQIFTAKRITGQPGTSSAQTAANSESALANLLYIASTVEQANPDVFVILETLSGPGGLATLGTGEGPNGVLGLLAELRSLHSAEWCAVPPLRVNPRIVVEGTAYTETVGVFWRNDRVRFDGPFDWPAGAPNATGPSIRRGTGVAGTYPAPWADAVPGGTTAAAQCRFYNANGDEILFTEAKHRRPYLTTFVERAGAAPRSVRIFSVHTKPGPVAQTAVARLVSLQNQDWMPGNGQVTVFTGDFNLNLRNPSMAELAVVQQMSGRTIYEPNGTLPPSRYLPRARAMPAAYLTNQLLDYAFVYYGTNAEPNPVLPLVVVDRVAGVEPPNLPAFTRDMGQRLATILAIPPHPIYTIAAAPAGAVRAANVTTITTTVNHDLQAGSWFRVAGVANNTFNGEFTVTTTPTAQSFTYAQPRKRNARSGGGTATPSPIADAFRLRWNFGHLGPPAQNVGTSDHLPIFFIV